MLLRRRFSEIFDNYAEAFVFLDINSSGDLSPQEFKRGLWRLNLHEIWRCPFGAGCCRYDCGYEPPPANQRAPNLHSYLAVDDDMARELLLRMDTQGGGTNTQISIDIKGASAQGSLLPLNEWRAGVRAHVPPCGGRRGCSVAWTWPNAPARPQPALRPPSARPPPALRPPSALFEHAS